MRRDAEAGERMRTARQADVGNITKLEAELFPANNMNEVTIGNELSVGLGWVIYDEEILAGYLLAHQEGELLDIIRLGVKAGYQGMGIGRTLLDEALAQTKVAMLTVKKTNQAALRLYLQRGFEIVGHLPEDAGWVMKTS